MMNMVFENHRIAACLGTEFTGRLKEIYAAMDHAYRRAAENYRFNCEGCRDNCCRSRFYHHTLIEYAYLLEGLNTLAVKKQNEIKWRARDLVDQTPGGEIGQEAIRPICPLNFDALCIVYPYRPMICRLHGIPHELKKSDQKTLFGPGCATFYDRCGHKSYYRFDRTAFYRKLAKLEREVRQSFGYAGKMRMTVAQMILADA
jgi:Fe-S-cluster containining protein